MKITDVVNEVINKLPSDLIIHRYNAYSTNSVYLKFDYGIANSLRISDHEGKKHLKYKYNILMDIKEPYCEEQEGFTRYFFPPTMIDFVINTIINEREKKIANCNNYERLVEWKSQSIEHEKGFWQQAREIKR